MKPLIQPVLAAASGSGENTPLDLGATADAHSSGGGSLVRTIVGLAVVLAVIYGLHWVLKQVKASREERADGSGLTSVATLPLGSNRSLHVVRAGQEVLVVGSGEHGVTPVRSYSEAEARALGILEAVDPGEVIEVTPPRSLPGPRGALTALRGWTVRG